MKQAIQGIKQDRKVVITVCIMFLTAFLYNAFTPYTTDDYCYMLNFANGSRITNPLQIFESLWDHYLTIHGRILPHFFVQLILMLPKWVFNIINAFVFTAIIWMMLEIGGKKKFSIVMFAAAAIGFWIYVPAYGQIFLWLTGSINYSWAFLFSLIYMKFYINLYQKPDKRLSKKGIFWLSFYSLFFGAYSELVSFPVVFICFILVCLVMLEKRSVKKYWQYCIPMVTGAIGYLTMLLSPAESSRQAEFSIGAIFKSLIDIFESYYTCAKPLLFAWAILLAVAVYIKADKKVMVVSGCFLLISLISMSMLSIASYVVSRHYAIPVFYLLVAVTVLMQEIRDKGSVGCIPYCICAYLIVASLWSLWEGTYDIYDVYRQNTQREAYLYEQAANGEEVVTVTMIRPLTKYSCKYDLSDIGPVEASAWPNPEIAKYYGLKMIYGVEPK